MSQQSTHLLRDEALRLIELTQKILTDMCEVPGLLTQEDSELAQTLDKKSAVARIKILEGEKHKLKIMDMVLAVVGTMKAGKSTTINAIVGTEVLPNRSAPMTAIPTLIRHTPGQIDPELTLDNIGPIEKTRSDIRKKLESSKNNSITLEDIKQKDADLYELANNICHNVKQKKQHTGADEIFKFLKGINDLVRLAPLVGVEFPFDDYADVDTLPVIRVQFTHLKDNSEKLGTLTLLDTPGPNESGQNRLRPMLKDQLRKASAVLAVIDYTQLKSRADAQIREDLEEISDVAKDKIFALLNKFDQRGSNDPNESDTKTTIHDLMKIGDKSIISKENIFLVSSLRAYLAARAIQAINQAGKLPTPNPEKETWVNSFGKIAFGQDWEDEHLDAKIIQEKAGRMLQRSGFEDPVERVIRMAHSNAAALALDSAAKKLTNTAEALHTLCVIRNESLKKKTSELQELVKSLQDDIEKITKCERSASKKQKDMLEEFRDVINEELESVKKSTTIEVKKYLGEGRAKEAEIRKSVNSTEKALQPSAPWLKILDIAKEFINASPRTSPIKEGTKEINFGQDKKSAEDLIKNIEKAVSDIIEKSGRTIEGRLDSVLHDFENDFQSNVIDSANRVVQSLQEKMNREGFMALSIQLPERTGLDLKLSGTRMLSDAIEAKSRTESRKREQSGIWGGTKRLFGGLFGANWGFDEFNVQVTDYKVDIEKIKAHVAASINESFDGLADDLRLQVDQPLKVAADKFFATFRGTVEGIRGDLQQSVADKAKDHATQQSIIDHLNHLKKTLPAQIADANALSADVKVLMGTATA